VLRLCVLWRAIVRVTSLNLPLRAGQSYRKTKWLTKAVLTGIRPQLITAFIRKTTSLSAASRQLLRPEWLEAERVVAMRMRQDKPQYLVKWNSLGYSEATWEAEEDLQGEQVEVGGWDLVQVGWGSCAIDLRSPLCSRLT